MNEQKLIQIFYFISFNFLLLYAKLPETLFGIKLRSLEDEYARLLFDQSLDLTSRQMLSVQLSAVQLCIDIDRDLALNDSRITKFANLAKKNKKKKVDIDMRTEFDQLRSNISQNKIVSPVDVCHLWEFQLLLNDLNQALNQDGIFLKEVKVVNKNYDCNELKNIDGILPIWAPDFKKNITLRHLKFISSKLASDFIIKDFSRWFSTERFANECVLLHRFRIINAGGDFEQTLRVKSVLTQFLLSNQDIDMLDMFYPFEAAADVLFEETFARLVFGMFDVIPEQSSESEEWLEFFFVFGKILSIFRQFKHDENNKNKLEILWKSFVKIVIHKRGTDIKAFFIELHRILNELKSAFGTLEMAENYKRLIKSYGNYLTILYTENEQFRKAFAEKIVKREKLKQIFEIVDEHRKIMTSKIWEIFEVMVNINPIVYDENETYKMNLYMECPNDQVVYHLDEIDQNEIAEDLEAYTLMQSYYNLMEKVENSQKNKQIKKLLQKLEMDAAVWVYKDLIQQELFEFAAFLDVRTDEFDTIIEHYSSEWYEVSTNEGQSVYNALCSIHQFAQTIVEDTILMQNVGWNFHVKSLLETPTSLYDTKLILLPTEKGTDLVKIDCSDGKLAYKFVQKIQKVINWIEGIHYYAFSKLINKFVRFQCIFCFGFETTNRIQMKQKFSWVVPSVVFEAVEATFPEIMQYDLLLDSQYISLLVYRLLFKTGTNFAKFYEARIANHFMLYRIKLHEASLRNGLYIENSSVRQLLLTKIVERTATFYDGLKNVEMSTCLHNLCQLLQFYAFLSKALNSKTFSTSLINAWKPECDSEKDINDAFEDQRQFLNGFHFGYLNRLLLDESFRAQLMAIPGAKTRIWKMTSVQQPHLTNDFKQDNEFLKLWDEAGMTTDVFNDDRILHAHYNCILFGELSCTSTSKMGTLLLADFILFVRWVENRIGTARHTIANKRMANSWEKDKKQLDNIYDQIYDEDDQAIMLIRFHFSECILDAKQYMESHKTLPNFEKNGLFSDIFNKLHQIDMNKIMKYKKWMGRLHKDVIFKLIKEDEAFAVRLKTAYESEKAIFKHDLSNLVDTAESYDEILNSLYVVDKSEDKIVSENKFDNLNLLEDTSPKTLDNLTEEKVKKKNKKSKNKKNNKKTENNEKSVENTAKNDKTESENKIDKKNSAETDGIGKNEDNNCNNQSENVQDSNLNEIFYADAPENYRPDFVGVKLSSFEDNNFLAKHFKNLVETMLNDSVDPSINSNVQLLHFGIYANEIFHRIELVKHIKKMLQENGIDPIEKFENEWNQIKSIELSKIKNVGQFIFVLFLLLKQIVAKMDKFEVKRVQNLNEYEENIVRNQLIMQKCAKFFAENDRNYWFYDLSQLKQIGIIKALFETKNIADAEIEEQMLESFKNNLIKYKKLDFQRKLDKNCLELYKSDEFLMQNYDAKLKKANIDLYQISDAWQQIDFDEITSKNFENVGAVENKEERNVKLLAINQLKNIFEYWSDEARFQMPVSHYLKPANEAMNTICMLPEWLKSNVFGIFFCNMNERHKCVDNSLYCKLCKDSKVQFLLKHSMDKLSLVPKFEIIFLNVHFVVHFVVVPVVQVPKANFDARQMQIFLHIFGKHLHELVTKSYIDDGTYAFDQNKSDQLKRQLEEEVFLTDNDDDVVRILDALEKINNLKASNKIESVNPSGLATMNHENDKQNRQKMENIKANLTILSSHAFHLKILEFLLTRNELYQINHKLDENVMNGSRLRNFRAAYAYLELWAKKRNIFNANFGHYNSQVIIILLTKVFLLFPGNVSVPFLLEKFFFIFSTWDWPLPLQLSEIEYKKEGEFLSWTTGREWFDKRQENNSGQQFSLQMPIISPVFPEQNMTKLINASDAKKIQNEFLIAFKKIRAVKEGMTSMNEPLKAD